MNKKETKRTRYSNRTYLTRLCQKTDCNSDFIPTDSRQIYCSKQHQIDANNDKRKLVDLIEKNFTKIAKNNKRILIKIINNEDYKMQGHIEYAILKYEGFNHDIFHSIKLESRTNREVKFCYDYGLMLVDSVKNIYKIYKI